VYGRAEDAIKRSGRPHVPSMTKDFTPVLTGRTSIPHMATNANPEKGSTTAENLAIDWGECMARRARKSIYQFYVDSWIWLVLRRFMDWLNKLWFKRFDQRRALNHNAPVLRASGLGIAILLGLIIASARVDKIMALREEALAKKSRAPPPLRLIQFIMHSFVGTSSVIRGHQSSSAEEAPCMETSLITLEPKTSTSITFGSVSATAFLARFSADAASEASCLFAYLDRK
jgi:hypothetical protein